MRYDPSDVKAIVFEVSHPVMPVGPITGFRFLWAMYVTGYDPAQHCQPGLKGRRVDNFSASNARSGIRITCDRMDRYPYLYICGVSSGSVRDRESRNLHVPLRYEAGAKLQVTTYNGYRLQIENAVALPVPPLPDDFAGLPKEHARCRTFQFAVHAFGHKLQPATIEAPTRLRTD